MRSRSFLVGRLALFAGVCLFAAPALAAPAPGTLIKGPGDAVYYYSKSGKRFVFPTTKTYATWYADFSGVTTISSGDLAAIPLGGNVTYRPGVKLVKVTTDPKVYAVSSHGTLRCVSSEAVASALYGADWNTKIDDIPDAFFVNYSVGATIVNASDFQPAAQTAAATDIDTDKVITAEPPPTPTPTPTPTSTTATSTTFTSSKMTVQGGDVITLTASAIDPIGISKIELFFDGTLIKTCVSNSCAGDTQVPTSGTKSSYVVEGRVTKMNGTVDSKTLTLPVQSDGAGLVHITVGQAIIMPNQYGSAIVDVDASIAINRVDIYVNGTDVKGCTTGARECRWSDIVTGAIGSVLPVYAKVTDSLGRTYTSRTLTITLGTNDTPSVTVTPAKTSIYAGESVDITVTASDSDGIASIDVVKDGIVLKHCDGAAPCTATTGPWNTAGTVLSFTGTATDTKGNSATSDPQTVAVTTQP